MDNESVWNSIASYVPLTIEETPFSSAVMVLLVFCDKLPLSIVLTERSKMLSSYSGDYCLPGGTKDLTDASLMMTAVRELEEEICLKNGDYKIIGQLDDFTNGKKRLVRPFVASVTKQTLEKQQCCPNSEVQSIYLFPFQEVFKIQESTDVHHPSYRYPSYRYHNEHIYLWGLTASIIVHLANVISGETRPVGRHCNFLPK